MSAIVEIRGSMEDALEELKSKGYRVVLTKQEGKNTHAAIKPFYYTCWIKRDLERLSSKLGSSKNVGIISIFSDVNGAEEKLKSYTKQTTLF